MCCCQGSLFLNDLAAALANTSVEPNSFAPRDKDISLVALKNEGGLVTCVTFVYWFNADARTGRRLSYYPRPYAVQAIVNARVPLESFSGCNLLIGRCPFVMVMRKRAYADRVPDWCFLVKRRAEALCYTGPLVNVDGPPHVLQCIVCEAADRQAVDRIDNADSYGMYVCSQCLCLWHKCCAVSIAKAGWYSAAGDDLYSTIHRDKKPDSVGFVCPVCIGIEG